MQVGDIARREVVSARPTDRVRDAIRTLEDLEIRHLPIVDDDGSLMGMISDRDLREYRVPLLDEIDDPDRADDLLDTALSEVMSADVVSVDVFEDLRAAVDLMLEYRVGAVPVVEGDELVGILSYVDVLRAARDAL
jgi:acetoin utilization protein AcuB